MMKKVIKASAGTGKTYRLSLEYLKLLIEGASPTEILVSTFTKKASSEIKERILQHLDLLLKKDKGILDSLKRIGVTKINYNLIKDIYKDILFDRVSFRISTIDSFINNIFNKFVMPYFNFYDYKIISEDQNSQIIEKLLISIIKSESKFEETSKFFSLFLEKNVTSYIAWVSEFIENRWKFLLVKQKKRSYKKEAHIDKAFSDVLEHLDALIKKKGLEGTFKNYLKEDYKEIAVLKSYKPFLEKRFDLFLSYSGEGGFWDGVKLRKSKKCIEKYENLKGSYDEFKKILSDYIFNKKVIVLEKEIFKFSKIIFSEYDKLKHSERQFTHNDILLYTYMFIDQIKKDGAMLKEILGFNYVLLDEFQDTSVIQWFIINLIVEKSKKFVAVGDDKQAIYGWRGGEQKLFENLDSILECKSETLDRCFRSRRNVVDVVNKLFSKLGILKEKIHTHTKGHEGYVNICLEEKQEAKKRVISLLEKNKFNNVTILAKTNTDLEEIALLLKERGLPFSKESSMSLLQHRAVKPIFSLIKFLVRDDMYDLLAFLRSEYVNISSVEMKKILENRNEILQYLCYEKDQLSTVTVKAVHLLKKLKSDFTTVKDLYKSFRVFEKFSSENDVENLKKFYECATNYSTLSGLLYFLENNSLTQSVTEDPNIIKLMTIHKSKGLEFDNVILYWHFSSRSVGKKKMNFNLVFNESFNEVLDFSFTPDNLKNVLKHLNDEDDRVPKFVREELNAFYVGMTRAKNNLISVISFDRGLSSLENMNVSTEKDAYIFNVKEALLSLSSMDKLKKHGFEKGKVFRDIKKKALVANNNMGVSWNDEKPKEITFIGEKRDITVGILAHEYLSNIEFYSEESVERAASLCKEKFFSSLSIEEMDNIFSNLKKFVKSSKYFKFNQDIKIYNESSIFYKGKEYRIDRVMKDDKNKDILILDYKTGKEDREQIKTYKRAMSSIYKGYNIKGEIVRLDIE